jgi:hypothetical protein
MPAYQEILISKIEGFFHQSEQPFIGVLEHIRRAPFEY